MDNQEERIALQSVPIHYLPKGIEDYEDYWFPINHNQVRDILGKILTQIEAMNLPTAAEKANKAIFTQMVWGWFDGVMDNSATAAPNSGLLPINGLVSHAVDMGEKSTCLNCEERYCKCPARLKGKYKD